MKNSYPHYHIEEKKPIDDKKAKTQSGKSFDDKVQELKRDSLPELERVVDIANQSNSGNKNISVKDFFSDKKIDYSNVQDFSKTIYLGDGKSLNDGMLGSVTFSNKEQRNQILDEVRDYGPFNTPQDLAIAIAKYIQSHMGYTFKDYYQQISQLADSISRGDAGGGNFSDLFDHKTTQEDNKNTTINKKASQEDVDNLFKEMISKIKQPEIEIINISTVVKRITSLFDDQGIIYSEKEIKDLELSLQGLDNQMIVSKITIYLTKKLDTGVDFSMEFSELSRACNDLRQKGFIKISQQTNISPEKIEELIDNMERLALSKNRSLVRDTIHNGKLEEFMNIVSVVLADNNSNKEGYNVFSFESIDGSEVYDYIKNIKFGVCRHFSSVAKLIYENLKGEITNKQDSELVTVVNMRGKHAYNLLLTEKSDGSIKKEYFDITEFITGRELQKPENGKGMHGKTQNEFLVNYTPNNNSDTSSNIMKLV